MRELCAQMRCLQPLGNVLCLALCAVLLVPGVVGKGAAADVSVLASVDKTEATVDDFFLLTIKVAGARAQPNLGEMRDFEVQSRGSSTQMRFVNGQMSSSVEYTYLLRPRTSGRFTIGPFSVSHGGTRYQSNTIELTVTRQSRQQRTERTREYFVTATVDNSAPYQYQQILYTFSFYRSVPIANATLVERPSFEGFLVEDLGKEREREQVINGRRYVVTEIRQVLFPTRTGPLRIEPSRLQCDVVTRTRGRRGFPNSFFFNDPFGGFNETVPASLHTDGIDIQVRPLPVAGKPVGFQDLVGSFQLQADVSAGQVAVGDSATITLKLTGRGNLQTLGTIGLPGSSSYKIYDDKPVFESDTAEDVFGGTLTVKKALVPLAPGTLQIPPLSIAYFDPARGRYASARTAPIEIKVVPGEEQEQPLVSGGPAPVKQEVVVLGHDILPVRALPRALVPDRYSISPGAAAAAFLAPILLFFGVVAAGRLRGQGESQRLRAGARKAHVRFRKQIREARSHLQAQDAAFYQSAGKAVRDFVADKLGLARGGAQTAEDIARQLEGAGVPAALISGLREVLQFCDQGQFGYERHGEEEKRQKLDALCDVIARLNRRL